MRYASLLPAALLLAITATIPHVQAAEEVTFSRQIAPILYTNCAVCHHTGGSGPFPLTSYPEAKRWAALLKQVTQTRYMPPWLPEPGHGDFAGTRRLTEEQIALIAKWADAGAPEGNPSEAPPKPTYSPDWQLGPPDLILEVDSPTQVPASGTDLFRNLILPVPVTQTRWVRAMEIKPGSPQVVHHANLLIDRTASLRRAHPRDWKLGIPGMDINVDAGESFDPDSHFLNWKPDSTALVEPPGMPWRIDPGNDLVLNEHLKPTGKVESVRARIGLYFTDQPATRFPILLQLEHDAALDIPAGNAAFPVEDHLTLPEDVDVLAIYPHAHYLGHRLEAFATLPSGARTDLILIPAWDIDRQSIYRFATPVFLPAGSVVQMRFTYDNSAANPHNPHTPPIRVKAGNRSEDEMGHLWLQVLPRATPTPESDPRAPLMRAWMENRLSKSPNDPEALFNLASLDLAANNPAEATPLYRKALAASPKDPRIANALASSLYKQGDSQQALAQFQQALTLDPTSFDTLYNLATLEAPTDPTQALQHLQAAANARPTDLDTHRGLVALYSQSRNLPQALHEQQTIVTLDPTLPAEWDNLGVLQVQTGNRPAARRSFEQALHLDPTNASAANHLAHLETPSS